MKGLIFTYLLTYGGAVASLFNPFIGLLIYICFAIVKPDCMWFWAVPQGNYSRIVAIALLLGWVFQGFGDWRLGRARGIVLALVGFWGWMVVATAFAQDPEVAWASIESISKIFLPFLVGITTIRTVRQLKQLAWVMVLSQGYVALEFNLSYYGGYNRLLEEGFGAMDNNCNAIALVTAVGLTFFLILSTRNLLAKGLALGLLALMIHAVLFSFSRGGMLALIITGGVALMLLPKNPQNLLIFFLVFLIGLRLAGKEIIQRFVSTFADKEQRDASALSRIQLWSACWQSMQLQPLGLGPDQWPLEAP